MNRGIFARIEAGALIVALGGAGLPLAHGATYTTPRQLLAGDTYQLNPDGIFPNVQTNDEHATCPKTDLNDGANSDNPYFQRTNVATAHLGGCSGRYWYTSADQTLCTDNPPINTCGAGPCVDEPNPAGTQYVDYTPPFGAGANQLTPGRYQITGEYRNTTSRAPYPAQYIVNHAGGSTTVNKSQLDGVSGSCPSFDIGTFDLNTGSFVRVNDTGNSSITFNQMRFTLMGPLGGIPYVNAGHDLTVILPASANLQGVANDDGQPSPLTVTWSKFSGPGTVSFFDPTSPSTTASFSLDGTYVLRLTAFDGLNAVSDDVTITVLASGVTLTYSTQYEFNSPSPDPRVAAGVIDANGADANGAGLLLAGPNGATHSPGGFANDVFHYVDNSSSGERGLYWNNAGGSISFTVDMRIKVNSGVGPSGQLGRRSMGFSAGSNMNRGLRVNQPGGCAAGSAYFIGTDGQKGIEGCADLTGFRRLRVTVNASDNMFRVYDLDAGTELTSTTGGGSGPADPEVLHLGGFHIGSIMASQTTDTDFEVDYFRVLLGVAVESPTTTILQIGQCNQSVFADVEPAPNGDGDVDVNDFAFFQACVTGDTESISDTSCRCFDRNSDNHINEFDFTAFTACASRAGVPANTLCDGAP